MCLPENGIEYVICANPAAADRVASLVAAGELPRLYPSLEAAILGRRKYPRFGGGRYSYNVYGVDVKTHSVCMLF